jgi:arylsulfatase A-like enzyme
MSAPAPPPRPRLFWALALCGLASGAACRRRVDPPRNLILIVIDTLRRDHLATYGYERDTAPTLRQLAESGAILDGLSPSSWTQPATASILTGLHPVRHQSVRTEPWSPAADTLAARLKRRGYTTLGVSANGLVTADWGFDRGFDEFVSLPPRSPARRPPTASDVNAAISPRLGGLRPPFFLYVHYIDPHAPYSPARSWTGAPLGDHLERRGPVEASDLDPARYLERPGALLRDAVDLYDGEIRQADDGLAALIAELRSKGLLERTVTIVTSDHGEEFQDHGRAGHGQSLYEEVLRVPLIVQAPGLVRAGTRHGTASLMDILPTALSLLGLPQGGPSLDGVDLATSLRSGRRYDDPLRIFLAHLDTSEATGLALTLGGDKLLLGRPYRKQLFDLNAGPRETDNRIEGAAGRERAGRLALRLAETYNALAHKALPRAGPMPTATRNEALAALGYVGSAPAAARSLGSSIRPADPGDDGLLGWEDVSALTPCVRPGDPNAAAQLLEGWYPIEANGRWTWPRATALLAGPGPGSGQVLVVEGVNHESRPARFRVSVGNLEVLDRTAPPGVFRFETVVREATPSASSVVRVERPEAFVPSRIGLSDGRVLGVFLTSLCLVR